MALLRRHLLVAPLALAVAPTWVRAAEPATAAPAATAGARPLEPLVIVSAGSPLRDLQQAQVVAYFTGRQRALPNGEAAQPLDLPPDHPLRDRFYRLLTGYNAAQMNSYWARLSFSGQMRPPLVVESEAAMVRQLRENPRTIGYLSRAPDDERLRVLLTLRAPA